MARFDGRRVSREWAVILGAARRDGVAFRLNSGRRTLAQQAVLRAAYERYLRGGPWAPRAAVPSPSAPHIRSPHHAVDIDASDGGAARLARWLRSEGARPAFTVRDEPWHLELSLSDVRTLARRLRVRFPGYPADERRWLLEYGRRRRGRRSARDRVRLRVLRRVMTRRRKAIWRAAQRSGWAVNRRLRRYRSLLARTR